MGTPLFPLPSCHISHSPIPLSSPSPLPLPLSPLADLLKIFSFDRNRLIGRQQRKYNYELNDFDFFSEDDSNGLGTITYYSSLVSTSLASPFYFILFYFIIFYFILFYYILFYFIIFIYFRYSCPPTSCILLISFPAKIYKTTSRSLFAWKCWVGSCTYIGFKKSELY
jgi:hypothetical protein